MYSLSEVKQGANTFLRRKGAVVLSLCFAIILFTTFCFIQNGGSALQAFSFDSLSIFDRFVLFVKTLYAVSSYFNATTLVITTIGSILGGFSLAAGYEYFLIRKEAIDKSSIALTTFSYALVIIGIHCASCGVVLVTMLLSIFGNLLAPDLISSLSVWFGFIGLVVQGVVLWILLGKLSRPLVC
jgi:hypothetical protein